MVERKGNGVDPAGRDLIELRLPPRVDMIATARMLASDVAGRADFDLDTVSDVRMAVDEACIQVARRADPRYPMRVGLRLQDGSLRVTVSARTVVDETGIDTDGFGWHVLTALCDELGSEHGRGPDGDVLIVWFAKKDPGA